MRALERTARVAPLPKPSALPKGLRSRFWKRFDARVVLGLYVVALLGLSFVHSPFILGGGLLLAMLCAMPLTPTLLKKTALTLLGVNLSVSLAYLFMMFLQGGAAMDLLLRLNLRVALFAFLGFWLIARVNFSALIARFPLLSLVYTLAMGQIKTFERVLSDYRFAFKSRNITRPTLLARVHQTGAQMTALLDKTQSQASEVALAMRARGVFEPPIDPNPTPPKVPHV